MRSSGISRGRARRLHCVTATTQRAPAAVRASFPRKVVPLTLRVKDSRAINEPNLLWTEEEMRKLPKEKLEATLWGGYAHEPTQKWIELRDGASFTNHSDKPNCEANWSNDPYDEEMHTIKDIKAGEEILEDYG